MFFHGYHSYMVSYQPYGVGEPLSSLNLDVTCHCSTKCSSPPQGDSV